MGQAFTFKSLIFRGAATFTTPSVSMSCWPSRLRARRVEVSEGSSRTAHARGSHLALDFALRLPMSSTSWPAGRLDSGLFLDRRAGSPGQMPDEEPLADVIINIHKGQGGYGIYFTQREGQIVVTKVDEGSEAQKAGVQPDDRLVSVQDNDKALPQQNPGGQIFVTLDNYGLVLDLVRSMKHCKMSFLSKGMQQFL
jgi:hypothetical protein